MNGISTKVNDCYVIDFSTSAIPVSELATKEILDENKVLDSFDKTTAVSSMGIKNSHSQGLNLPVSTAKNIAVTLSEESAVEVLVANNSATQLPTSREALEHWVPYVTLSPLEKQEVRDILDKNPDILAAVSQLIDNEKFRNLIPGSRFAMLHGCRYYPNSQIIGQLVRMLDTSWFKVMEPDDARRAVKVFGTCAQKALEATNAKQRQIIENTIDFLFNENLTFKFDEDSGLFLFMGGYSDGKNTICLTTRVVRDNGLKNWFASLFDTLLQKPSDTFNLDNMAVEVLAHELNHAINQDRAGATYKYFQAEYRAWYVGQLARNGKEPTRQEAFDRCLELFKCYPLIKEALYSKEANGLPTAEARQIINYLSMFAGVNFDMKNPQVVEQALNLRVTNKNKSAPLPDKIFNPVLDNANVRKNRRDGLQASFKQMSAFELQKFNTLLINNKDLYPLYEKIVSDPAYQSLPLEQRNALVLGFTLANGDSQMVSNIASLAKLSWFKEMLPDDARRAVNLIASISKTIADPNTKTEEKELNQNNLERLLNPANGYILKFYDDNKEIDEKYLSSPDQFNRKYVLLTRSLNYDIALEHKYVFNVLLSEAINLQQELAGEGLLARLVKIKQQQNGQSEQVNNGIQESGFDVMNINEVEAFLSSLSAEEMAELAQMFDN